MIMDRVCVQCVHATKLITSQINHLSAFFCFRCSSEERICMPNARDFGCWCWTGLWRKKTKCQGSLFFISYTFFLGNCFIVSLVKWFFMLNLNVSTTKTVMGSSNNKNSNFSWLYFFKTKSYFCLLSYSLLSSRNILIYLHKLFTMKIEHILSEPKKMLCFQARWEHFHSQCINISLRSEKRQFLWAFLIIAEKKVSFGKGS